MTNNSQRPITHGYTYLGGPFVQKVPSLTSEVNERLFLDEDWCKIWKIPREMRECAIEPRPQTSETLEQLEAFERLAYDAVCPCCGMPLQRIFIDAFMQSRYNSLPCVMWWRGMEVLFSKEDTEDRVSLGWLGLTWQLHFRDRSLDRIHEALAARAALHQEVRS